MESRSVATISSAQHCRSLPDVPEDVALLHFNDPNYDPNYDLENEDISSANHSFELHVSETKRYTSAPYGQMVGTDASEFVDNSAIRADWEDNDDSPYPEVRAAVSNTDDPTMPVNTFRMWLLGTSFTVAISALNQFFSMRYPSVYISGLVVQLAAFPAGRLLARILPTTRFHTLGYTWTFNPGPFSIKEHTLVTVMANVVATGVYATDVIATQQIYFGQHWGLGYQLALCLSSQLVGFAFAGAACRVLVWPASMIWPGALVNAALLGTLHRSCGVHERNHVSRESFFVLAMLASFVWYWFPGYIFTALSVFNWACWIAPDNVVVNQIFGYSTGLGVGFLTFDWSMISFIGSPLVVPWWAQVNTIVAFVLVFWIITPILYYNNVFFTKFLPMSASQSFDRTGMPYNASAIIINGVFDADAYHAYSPLFLPVTFVLAYGISFASMTSVLVHTFLWYRGDIMRQLRRSLRDHRDVHARLMSVYPEVPQHWYTILGLCAFVLAVVTVEVFDTKLPTWGLVLALAIALAFLVPVGMVQAITNQTVALQILAELVAGYALPGRPVATMVFKTFAFIALKQALAFLGDLKLGHYMKVPPRAMFRAQVAAAALAGAVSVLVQAWMFAHVPDLCAPDQPSRLTCPSTSVFATAALVWGGIGPQRLFSSGALYFPLMFFFLIGALAPIPFYVLAKRYPLSLWRYVNMPVFFAGVNNLPPATGINFSSWFAVGAIFQYYMRRFHFRWWMRYNYILSAALDAGVALALIAIFFALQFPGGGVALKWWGNTVWQDTADARGVPFYALAPGAAFGPLEWS